MMIAKKMIGSQVRSVFSRSTSRAYRQPPTSSQARRARSALEREARVARHVRDLEL